MRIENYQALVPIVIALMLSGCAAMQTRPSEPVTLAQAAEEIPEAQLMNVGILVFEGQELDEEKAQEEGTHPEVRKAENHYIPYHLKNTLQRSGQWGSVWLLPDQSDSLDLVIRGEIIESNGATLELKIMAEDATGHIWLEKRYEAASKPGTFIKSVPGESDGFQDLYNTVANELAAFKQDLKPEEVRRIRTVARLRFASALAPEAFDGYVQQNSDGEWQLDRLPADEDPLMQRLLSIREREFMYLDTLNGYYEGFYTEMWPDYANWRKSDRIERVALKQMRRDAFVRKAGGVFLVGMAIALDMLTNGNTQMLGGAMLLGGSKIFYDGWQISKQTELHKAALQELSDSFGSEMAPVVMEYQGKQYELTGSAKEQFQRWRELLREIYYTETGFGPDADVDADAPAPVER